jgi:aminopeptidase N
LKRAARPEARTMFIQIARFEFRYLLRNPLLWATAAFTFGLLFIATTAGGFELGAEGGLLENASYAMLRNYISLSLIFMFATTSFVANVIIRDDETNFGPIVRSTQITKFQYLGGRFLGSFAASALCMLAMPLAVWIGAAMPFADAATLGPNRVVDHLYGLFLLALPNIFIHSAIFFALATITRSMMAMYLGVIGVVMTFFSMQGSYDDQPTVRKIVPLLDPFGSRALSDITRFWTIAERNVLLPDFAGVLLYNRLIWLAIAAIFLAVTYATFRFADEGMSKRERKRQKLMAGADAPVTENAGRNAGAPLPSPQHGNAASRAVLWLRTKFEIKQVVVHWAFPVLMAFGLYTTIFALITQRDPDGKPTYPTTLSLIPEIVDAFQVVPLLIALYYVGELVWRERDRRVHELVDASPMPNWAYVVPKTMAITIVLMAALLTTVVASIIIQLSLGYTHLEIGKYLLWYVLPKTCDLVLLAAMAIFIQSISPHKAVGWGIMILFYVALEMPELKWLIEHKLLRYGNSPAVPLSDLNGAGSFWKGAWTFRLYWAAFALLLLVGAHLLWRRGTEIRLKPRLANARRRLAGAPGWVAAAALIAFTGTGAYAYYNTNVLNEYRNATASGNYAAELERRYGKYLNVPQPLIVGMTLDVALYPEERRAVTKGRYRLRNETSHVIPEVHIRLLDQDLEVTRATLEGGRLTVDDPQFRYRIYRLDRPMGPGEERVFTCYTRYRARGFRNAVQNTSIVENGTFLSDSQLMPTVGMSYAGLMPESAKRRKYGLKGEIRLRKLEDIEATVKPNGGRGWATADVTVSTTADQTPLSAGNKVSDVTRGGRRTARFVSGSGVRIRPDFAVLSARYAEKHRRHAGVDLAVYYHPAHAWNVDRMLDAMASSLDYYQANFGPYQFDHARIVEFPGYGSGAVAFAGTIPYSETSGFVSDYTGPGTMDYVSGMTAHELAHQWWAHQVAPAEMEGALVLNETLAQYSAYMVIKKTRGADQLRRYLQYELDEYLYGRAVTANEETPLARVAGQGHIAYQKGGLVMYLLQERLGEAAVNRALRSVVERYKFKGAPYARSLDVVAALRAEAKTEEEQNLISDVWERITLYDLRVMEPSAVQRTDGKWDVTVPIEARKMYADGAGKETETPLNERIEVGLFTEKPGTDAFDKNDIVLMERQPIKSGKQVLKFVTATRPLYAGVDPYNFYIDRKSRDNLGLVQ